ncbi:hypothetical protein O988_07772 [Pseudogymnoascus sp. VKM F-3808]|nr:hypothetical protein O988_07772 [Pseudogymnoascus sp. VKM F-3808]
MRLRGVIHCNQTDFSFICDTALTQVLVLAMKHQTTNVYRVGVICPSEIVKDHMVGSLDRVHLRNGDHIFGQIGVHNVAVACPPAGSEVYRATDIVARMQPRLPSVFLWLYVDICGSIWNENDDIRLGDVVVSELTEIHNDVTQSGFEEMSADGNRQRAGHDHSVLSKALNEALQIDLREKGQNYFYPGKTADMLFQEGYEHQGGETCEKCNIQFLVERPPRKGPPKVHRGNLIYSTAYIVKRALSSLATLSQEVSSVACSADIHYMVIRGISDYGNSHKNETWQSYATAMAVSFVGEFIGLIDEQAAEQREGFESHDTESLKSTELSTSQINNFSGKIYTSGGDIIMGCNISSPEDGFSRY